MTDHQLQDLLRPPAEGEPERVIVCRMGRVAYEPVWELQRELQMRLVREKRSEHPIRLPHILLLVEHNPVYTIGKSGDEENLVWDAERRRLEGVSFHRIDRGGDITFHGPGQLVGYPILDLDRFFTDLHRYMRTLEEAVINTLAVFHVEAGRFPGRTGVWVGADARGAERKVCAMGVRVSRWVTMHGFALNVATELSFYQGIVPCGIDDRDVTSMALELGQAPAMETVMSEFQRGFGRAFGADISEVGRDETFQVLSSYLDTPLEAAAYRE